jgi:hypothetical protein
MVVGSKQRINSLVGDLKLSLNDISLRRVKSTKCLGRLPFVRLPSNNPS